MENINLMNEKVISLELRRKYKCRHGHFLVNEEEYYVECGKCGEKLNPIWVLSKLAMEESIWTRRLVELKEYEKKLDLKRRTKCKHCGKFTPVKA